MSGVAGDLNHEIKSQPAGQQFVSQTTIHDGNGGWNATNLVPQPLGGNDSDLIADTLIGLKVKGELWIVPLNDDLGGLLDGLGANYEDPTY